MRTICGLAGAIFVVISSNQTEVLAQGFPSETLCTRILDHGILDRNNVIDFDFGESYVVTVLQEASFSSYADLKNRSGSLGIDLGVADFLLGLSGSDEQ